MIRRFFAAAFVLALVGHAAPSVADLTDVLGVAHSNGKYYLTPDEDFVNEGADQVLATGSKTIKLYLTSKHYLWNCTWPKDVPI